MTDDPTVVLICPDCNLEIPLYNLQDAAAYVGLSEPGLKYHVGQGHIVPYKTNARSAFFTQEQLNEFDPESPGRPTRFVYETEAETE